MKSFEPGDYAPDVPRLDARMDIRCTSAELERYRSAAADDRRSLSDWVKLQCEKAIAHSGQK